MKIKHTEIKAVRGTSNGKDFNDVEQLRRFCAKTLAQAGRRGRGSVKLSVPATAVGVVATAKIAAQEIFRHVRQAKRPLRNIVVVGPSGKIFKTFKATIERYLEHMMHKICQGPFLTVDTIIEINGGVVLIKRSNPPFGWAIPGGFVDYGETLEWAAGREAREETSLSVKNLTQMHTYSDPSRDPRFHAVTTVFVGQAKGRPRAASDAQEAKIFKPQEWRKLPLAFDHRQVLEDYLKWKG